MYGSKTYGISSYGDIDFISSSRIIFIVGSSSSGLKTTAVQGNLQDAQNNLWNLKTDISQGDLRNVKTSGRIR